MVVTVASTDLHLRRQQQRRRQRQPQHLAFRHTCPYSIGLTRRLPLVLIAFMASISSLKQPRLQPGESFQYTSGAILRTPVGAMHGEYEFEDEQGRLFEVPIPPFSLSLPNMVH